ncbi:DUF1573 domain-containing protein [Desertivirga arenae]|uniref:DUF1573 domain-containing protein n=1 Tax=Desertivirga arenae TaxID=2810309 RepID=UPI001A971C88|nr:DUF1573 domain-containing protein [Pedobacter sp. SYSU D00823]
MRNFILTATVAVSVFLAACNNNKKEAKGTTDSTSNASVENPEDAPVIKFAKNSYDFGKIAEGEKVTYDFKFENTGKSPLIISNASASCGCTIPEFPHAPIPPKGTGVIKVVFNSAGKSGMQNKVVTITSNAVPSATEVYLIGEVEAKK